VSAPRIYLHEHEPTNQPHPDHVEWMKLSVEERYASKYAHIERDGTKHLYIERDGTEIPKLSRWNLPGGDPHNIGSILGIVLGAMVWGGLFAIAAFPEHRRLLGLVAGGVLVAVFVATIVGSWISDRQAERRWREYQAKYQD
jgi:hypothetical protein